MSEGQRTYLPLDPAVVEMLSADPWREVGISCRLALIGFSVSDDDLVERMGDLLDDMPEALNAMVAERQQNKKVLQRCLALLRAAERRQDKALNLALAARGF